MNFRFYFLVVFLSFSPLALSQECSVLKMSNADAVECLQGKLDKLDREVQARVEALIRENTPGPEDDFPGASERAPAIRQAQKSWLQYREDLCVNQIEVMYAGGSGGGIAILQCKIQLTKQRLASIDSIK